jgi:hypothetical protein
MSTVASLRPLSIDVRARSLIGARCAALVLLVAVLTASGCSTLFTRGDGVSDDERQQLAEETAPYLQKGSGSIAGVVRVDTDYGPFVAGRNTQVVLRPATTIACAAFEEDVVEANELPAPRKTELVLVATTNAAGHFRFDHLPPGRYLLASAVRWSPTGRGDEARAEVTYARVTLGDGDHAEVVVTRAVEE